MIEIKLTPKQLEILEALKTSPMSFDSNEDERTIKICNSLVFKGLVRREVDYDDGSVCFKIIRSQLKLWGITDNIFNGDMTTPIVLKKVVKVEGLKLSKGDEVQLHDMRIGVLTKYSSKELITIKGVDFETIVSINDIKCKIENKANLLEKLMNKLDSLFLIKKGDNVRFIYNGEVKEGLIVKYSSNKSITINVGDTPFVTSKEEITAKL